MDYLPPGNEFLPQGYAIRSILPPPNHGHPSVEHTPLAKHPQWIPLSSYDQVESLPSPAVQEYGNFTVSYRNSPGDGQLSQSLNPDPNETVAPPQQLPTSGGINSTSDDIMLLMTPPPSRRKRKARTLRDDDWEPVKARVIELHIIQNVSLPKVKQIVEEEFKSIEFRAT
jgi:hypothetical protein